jgi:hypothetical protein
MLVPTLGDALDVCQEAMNDAMEIVRRLSDDQTWQARCETDEIEVLMIRSRMIKIQRELTSLARLARGKTRGDLDA